MFSIQEQSNLTASEVSEPECSPNIYKLQGILGYTEINTTDKKKSQSI